MSEPGRHTRRRLRRVRPEFDKFRRDAFRESDMNDEMAEIEAIRVTQLEEIIAARWPRSILVRYRLARDIRASVRHVQGVYVHRQEDRGDRLRLDRADRWEGTVNADRHRRVPHLDRSRG